jgi:hypothetical protein
VVQEHERQNGPAHSLNERPALDAMPGEDLTGIGCARPGVPGPSAPAGGSVRWRT